MYRHNIIAIAMSNKAISLYRLWLCLAGWVRPLGKGSSPSGEAAMLIG